jgi:hypothetical protein
MRARFLAALRFIARRSSSDNPPQTPESCPLSSAQARHGSFTGQRLQIFLASSICCSAGPVFPTGKKISGSSWRQIASCRQSMLSAHPLQGHFGPYEPKFKKILKFDEQFQGIFSRESL